MLTILEAYPRTRAKSILLAVQYADKGELNYLLRVSSKASIGGYLGGKNINLSAVRVDQGVVRRKQLNLDGFRCINIP